MGTGVLDQLHEALSTLAGLDPDTLADAEVHELVVGLGTETNRLEAVWCGLLRVWDNHKIWAGNGSKAAGARLARDTHLRRSRADRLVARGRHLDTMPATAVAYAAGEINGDHVDLIATCDQPWRNAAFDDHEHTLVNVCRTPFFGVAAQGIAYWKHRADRDAVDEHGDTIKHRRHLAVSPGWDGEIVINGALDPVGGEVFKTELDRICEQLRLADLKDGIERTVHMPYLSDAEFERIVYDPPNRKIEASRRRSFTGAIRRIIEVRDRHCQLSDDCFTPANRCDVDHTVPYPELPVTCLCTGQIGCTTHNRIIKNNRKLPKKERTGDPLPCEYCAHLRPTTNTNTADPADTRAPPAAS